MGLYQPLVHLDGIGCYQAGLYSTQCQLNFYANEAWTATARGAAAQITVTPNGTTNMGAQSFSFDQDGGFRLSSSVGQKATGTTWVNPSDRRLKDEIADYATGLAAILQLRPRTFVFNGKGGSQAGMRGYGFVADEIAPVMPETVGVRVSKLTPEGADTDIATLDQSNLILALVNAVKELSARVADLEARNGGA
jgi:hypothetical protein